MDRISIDMENRSTQIFYFDPNNILKKIKVMTPKQVSLIPK